MSLRDIDRSAIEMTLREFDDLGRMPFLQKYDFGPATTYLLRHGGRFYDPKAIVGAAAQHSTAGHPLKPNEFDATEAIALLQRLGFEIVPFNGLWWVNQGESYGIERDGGYVWAPLRNKAGRLVGHHLKVNSLRVEQRIVHYANNYIRAVGTVREAPYTAPQPEALRRDTWINDGYLCPVDYRHLDDPIHRDDVPGRTSVSNGPFDVNGNIKQGYMFPVPPDYLLTLLAFLDERISDLFSDRVTHRHHDRSSEDDTTVVTSSPANPIVDILQTFKNVVLEGVPGTGKSYAIERVAKEWQGITGRPLLAFDGTRFVANVFHPSSSYEDFVEGLRPGAKDTDASADQLYFDERPVATGSFEIRDGFFLKVCARAVANPDKDVLVLLDELNRCNVPSVFGDLLLTLERSRRARYAAPPDGTAAATARDWVADTPASLPYSGRTFFVPDNVYIVATMNTTDRSIAPLDAALRRRFAFHRLDPQMPTADILQSSLPSFVAELFTQSAAVLRDLNEHVLQPCLGPDALLGHSYLYTAATTLNEANDVSRGAETIRSVWRYTILPQLIDAMRSFGAEDLLDATGREYWLDQHVTSADVANTARPALSQLDEFLQGSLGLGIAVQGTGLSRGAHIYGALP